MMKFDRDGNCPISLFSFILIYFNIESYWLEIGNILMSYLFAGIKCLQTSAFIDVGMSGELGVYMNFE